MVPGARARAAGPTNQSTSLRLTLRPGCQTRSRGLPPSALPRRSGNPSSSTTNPAPDGYTFLVAPTAAVAIAPWLRQVNFSAQDFIPVAKLACGYGLITGRKNEAFDDYRKFVAAAKAAPGKYTFASNGVGT